MGLEGTYVHDQVSIDRELAVNTCALAVGQVQVVMYMYMEVV